MPGQVHGHVNGKINGKTNGVSGHDEHAVAAESAFTRFASIPSALDIPVSSAGPERDDKPVEVVEVDLEVLMDDSEDICTLLDNENAARTYWVNVALAYAKQGKPNHAIDIVTKGMSVLPANKTDDRLVFLACLCWLNLAQCRSAPRTKPESNDGTQVQTKDHYIYAATAALNEASRISPTYSPLFLARGVLCLLRASLLPGKATTSSRSISERAEALQQAAKCFDDALRASLGRNVFAIMGKARALFSLAKYADALSNYQTALESSPTLYDPDPRIGIGCCLWQLGHKQDAHAAWQRALEVAPNSRIANVLLGIFHLDKSSHMPTSDPDFQANYKQAMTEYTQTAWKADAKYPLTCSVFGNYFLLRKAWPTVDRLARQAIELTDVTAIASDGWYLLARREHYGNDFQRATEYYNKADQARGGDDAGHLPAKFGIAQLKALSKDYAGAKFRLEKITQQAKNIEAMSFLGILHAEDYFSAQSSGNRGDKSMEMKKAIALFEQVRTISRDTKRTIDTSVLLNLARLYERDSPERSLQCLEQVEQRELEEIADEELPDLPADHAAALTAKRELLGPQLLNNLGTFNYRVERYVAAREYFQIALNACVKAGDKDETMDTDALVTTISFNLARTYESESMLTEARQVYESLLTRHPSYVDARIRLSAILLRQEPAELGPKAIKALQDAEPANLDVRALYGWYIHRSKKRAINVNEDPEQRHYKHSLQQYDKHDRYSLTGMGNLHLQNARDMRRDNEQEKEKRSKMYSRAVEFFDKALQLDPQNSYAAQGIGIALAEDRKDFGQAIQIFTKVRESIKDASVFLNLGHVYCEVKQYARAIESYEAALSRGNANDANILNCLGRAWYLRGKQEKSLRSLNTALEYAQSAYVADTSNPLAKFNIAFMQFTVAIQVNSMTEATRTSDDIEVASAGLDDAVVAFEDLAKLPNVPIAKNDLEQRSFMAKNTLRKHMDRAMQNQKEYEGKNATRLEQARKKREDEIQKREADKKQRQEAAEEQKRKLREERERMVEEDRQIAQRKAEELRIREEADMTTDEETGERRKREKKKAPKRKKKSTIVDDDEQGSEIDKARDGSSSEAPAGDDDESAQPKKKKRRKLERRSTASNKYKSEERIVDSGSEDEQEAPLDDDAAVETAKAGQGAIDDEDDDAPTVERKRKQHARVLTDDDEEDDAPPQAENSEVVNDSTGDVAMQDAPTP